MKIPIRATIGYSGNSPLAKCSVCMGDFDKTLLDYVTTFKANLKPYVGKETISLLLKSAKTAIGNIH